MCPLRVQRSVPLTICLEMCVIFPLRITQNTSELQGTTGTKSSVFCSQLELRTFIYNFGNNEHTDISRQIHELSPFFLASKEKFPFFFTHEQPLIRTSHVPAATTSTPVFNCRTWLPSPSGTPSVFLCIFAHSIFGMPFNHRSFHGSGITAKTTVRSDEVCSSSTKGALCSCLQGGHLYLGLPRAGGQ